MKKSAKFITILVIATLVFITNVSIVLADQPPWSRDGFCFVYDNGSTTKAIHTAYSGEDEDWICVIGNLRMDGDCVDSDVDSNTNSSSATCTTSATDPSGQQAWVGRSAFIFNTVGYDALQINDDTPPGYW